MYEEIRIVNPHKICPTIEIASGLNFYERYKPSLIVIPMHNIIKG